MATANCGATCSTSPNCWAGKAKFIKLVGFQLLQGTINSDCNAFTICSDREEPPEK